jgi:hypothetical protein
MCRTRACSSAACTGTAFTSTACFTTSSCTYSSVVLTQLVHLGVVIIAVVVIGEEGCPFVKPSNTHRFAETLPHPITAKAVAIVVMVIMSSIGKKSGLEGGKRGVVDHDFFLAPPPFFGVFFGTAHTGVLEGREDRGGHCGRIGPLFKCL